MPEMTPLDFIFDSMNQLTGSDSALPEVCACYSCSSSPQLSQLWSSTNLSTRSTTPLLLLRRHIPKLIQRAATGLRAPSATSLQPRDHKRKQRQDCGICRVDTSASINSSLSNDEACGRLTLLTFVAPTRSTRCHFLSTDINMFMLCLTFGF